MPEKTMLLLTKINRVMQIGAALAMFAIIGVTLYDVILGALTGRPVSGVYDIVETCLAFVIYLSVPEIFRTEGNIRIDLIDFALPTPVLRVVILFGRVLTLAFALLIAIAIVAPFRDAIEFGDAKFETGIPVWFIWLPILAGSFLAVLAAIAVLLWPSHDARIQKD
ncbi:hypothetical protein JT55_02270 [Rhodovulum sp. NI22]|jgi:TRAP-type C4-dicarboxylate transport system permease small subunit|nr:hypothetical protein JT55_02270 [Rhodovulum sp. NI22]